MAGPMSGRNLEGTHERIERDGGSFGNYKVVIVEIRSHSGELLRTWEELR